MWGFLVVGVVLLLITSECTWLKETPEFWRDAGGYPVALREVVLAGYYPLLGASTLLCAAFTVMAARCSRRAMTVGAVAMWLMWGFNVALLTANNVENVFTGRELHYHDPYPN